MLLLYIIIIILILSIVWYYLYYRELYYSDKIITGNNHVKFDKLMIVAHPDDETIFGSRQLIEEPGWKVVCITNASNKSANQFSLINADTRINEFITIMTELDCAYEIWDYEDNGCNANWHKSIIDRLSTLVNNRKYNKIVTHNLDGEYGHVQHKKISQIIHKINPPNLYVFNKGTTKNPYIDKINKLLSIYQSQKIAVEKFYEYVYYQNVKSVNNN